VSRLEAAKLRLLSLIIGSSNDAPYESGADWENDVAAPYESEGSWEKESKELEEIGSATAFPTL